jgi:hypothetical protein
VLIITGQKNNIEKFINTEYKGRIKVEVLIVDCRSNVDALIESWNKINVLF